MRIGIDLLWVRVGICGGTESHIRNLLDGFTQFAPENECVFFWQRIMQKVSAIMTFLNAFTCIYVR